MRNIHSIDLKKSNLLGKNRPLFIVLIIIVVITLIVTVGSVSNSSFKELQSEMEGEESYQIALDYVKNSPEVRQKHDSSEIPELTGVSRKYQDGILHEITFQFVYDPIPFTNIGDRYTIEMICEEGEWTVQNMYNR